MASGEDSGRIVVVGAGFALWQGGRCIAMGRWGDITRMQAFRVSDAADTVRVVVTLADGAVLELHENAPGFDPFLDRASTVLSTMRPFASWHPAMMLAPATTEGVTIYQRKF